MRRLHLEPFHGLAGDMFLGACLDLGMPLSVIEGVVRGLGLEDVGVEALPARRHRRNPLPGSSRW